MAIRSTSVLINIHPIIFDITLFYASPKKLYDLTFEGEGLFATFFCKKETVLHIFHRAYKEKKIPIVDSFHGRILIYNPDTLLIDTTWELLPPENWQGE